MNPLNGLKNSQREHQAKPTIDESKRSAGTSNLEQGWGIHDHSRFDRAADAVDGLTAAAHAVGLGDHHEMLRDGRQRVRDSHRAAMAQLGIDVSDIPSQSSGITVTGDIYRQESSQASRRPEGQSGVLPLLLAGGLTVVGVGLPAAFLGGKALDVIGNSLEPAIMTPKPTDQTQDTDTRSGLGLSKISDVVFPGL